jgi:hypothetical protein
VWRPLVGPPLSAPDPALNLVNYSQPVPPGTFNKRLDVARLDDKPRTLAHDIIR